MALIYTTGLSQTDKHVVEPNGNIRYWYDEKKTLRFKSEKGTKKRLQLDLRWFTQVRGVLKKQREFSNFAVLNSPIVKLYFYLKYK